MQTLKNMTYSGKTVILVTHSTLNLQVCDKIIFMGRGGNLCFFGSDREAKQFFQVDNLVDVYNMITEEPENGGENTMKWFAGTGSSLRGEMGRLRRQDPQQAQFLPPDGRFKQPVFPSDD